MAIRVVLAVLLAVALVGASTPAIERARVDAADRGVASQVDALLDAAGEFQRNNDPVPSGGSGARQFVTLDLPGETWGRAGVERVAVSEGTVTWRVEGGARRVRRPEIPLRGQGPDGSLVLDGNRAVTLELRLVQSGEGETVVVRRADERL